MSSDSAISPSRDRGIYEIETIKVKLAVSEKGSRLKASWSTAVPILRTIYKDLDADQEHFTLLALDQASNVRGYKVLFSGTQTASMADPGMIMRTALFLGSTRFIVAHNHPSENPNPSPNDRYLTERISRAADTVGISLLDHIILGGEDHFSFFNEELLKDTRADHLCYHRFGEDILEEIKQLLPLAGDDVTLRRIRRLLRGRGLSAREWKRLKLSEDESLRILKEHFVERFVGILRKADGARFEALVEQLAQFLRRERENEGR